MKLLVTASEITGLPVVTVTGGEDVAEVRDVIYSPERGNLVSYSQKLWIAGLFESAAYLPA